MRESAAKPRIFMKVWHDFFKFTTAYENGRGSHGERIGDTSRHEPWVFFLTTKSPRLSEKAVGVATKNRIFIKDVVDNKRVLDVGCGRKKVPGALGLDRIEGEGIDVVHDLNVYPYPLDTSSFDEIHARHVIEHIEDVLGFLAELHRIAKPGARVFISTPHYTYTGSWRDPTHRWHLSAQSFEYFEMGHPSSYYTGSGRFRIVSNQITMLRLWRLLGVEWVINAVNIHRRWRFLRRFWEEYLAFQFRAREIQVTFEVVKDSSQFQIPN